MSGIRRQHGFTLIELLLAMAFFSFILMFVTAAFLQVSRAYNKGITVKRVHESGRAIIADMSRSLAQGSQQSGSVQTSQSAQSGCLYVGGTRYVWNNGLHPSGSHGHALMNGQDFSLIRDNGASCTSPLNIDPAQALNMLDEKIIVQNITVSQIAGISNSYRLSVSLSSHRVGSNSNCNVIEDAYCDTVTLSTVVTTRN